MPDKNIYQPGDYLQRFKDEGGGVYIPYVALDTNVPIASPATAASLANVASSATNVTLKAANASRRGLAIFNDSEAVLYVKFGATASSSSFTVKIAAGGYYEMPQPIYVGIVDGIWASANGNARVTELT